MSICPLWTQEGQIDDIKESQVDDIKITITSDYSISTSRNNDVCLPGYGCKCALLSELRLNELHVRHLRNMMSLSVTLD